MPELRRTFHERLRQALRPFAGDFKRVAYRAGLSAGYLRSLKLYGGNPTLGVVERLAEATGVSPLWLAGADGGAPEPPAHMLPRRRTPAALDEALWRRIDAGRAGGLSWAAIVADLERGGVTINRHSLRKAWDRRQVKKISTGTCNPAL